MRPARGDSLYDLTTYKHCEKEVWCPIPIDDSTEELDHCDKREEEHEEVGAGCNLLLVKCGEHPRRRYKEERHKAVNFHVKRADLRVRSEFDAAPR